MWLIVGLGNPGNLYRTTRHNAGFLVLDFVASRQDILWKVQKHNGSVGKGLLGGEEAILVKPLSFMNRSGMVVGPLVREYGVLPEKLIVVHDDMDLPFDRLKIKLGGGAGGHKGVGSIADCLGSNGFLRVKMGIGRPEPWQRPEEYVLDPFSVEQAEMLPTFLELGAEAVESIVEQGIGRAMNRFNSRRSDEGKEPDQEKPVSLTDE